MWFTGKRYVFDVQRTFREAFDRARRLIYKEEQLVTVRSEETNDDVQAEQPGGVTDPILSVEQTTCEAASALSDCDAILKTVVASGDEHLLASEHCSSTSSANATYSKGTKRTRIHSGDQVRVFSFNF